NKKFAQACVNISPRSKKAVRGRTETRVHLISASGIAARRNKHIARENSIRRQRRRIPLIAVNNISSDCDVAVTARQMKGPRTIINKQNVPFYGDTARVTTPALEGATGIPFEQVVPEDNIIWSVWTPGSFISHGPGRIQNSIVADHRVVIGEVNGNPVSMASVEAA